MIRRELHDSWMLRSGDGPVPPSVAGAEIPAIVPGPVQAALRAAELIPDPNHDQNEAATAWVGLTDWLLRTELQLDAAERGADRVELVFDGLDTVARVALDGETLAETANQHRSYRIDVTDRVAASGSALEVALRSPVRYADEQSLTYGARPRPYPMPYEAIRKSASNFGWDWGIAAFTSGIWRPVRVESWSTARLRQTRVVAAPQGDGGRITVHVEVERVADRPLTLDVAAAGHLARVELAAGQTSVEAVLELEAVERWWPVGYGAQPLTDVEVRLTADDETLDTAARRVGFRTLSWSTEPDAEGTPFQLVVNDRPVWVKGVNWIPDDAFAPNGDVPRYRRRLEQARAANVNLVRVWGGGIYEDDAFYDLCDELGLLTWQDFAFVCAAYPEEQPLFGEVEAEARENIDRLAHHASLALLCGNNENLWGYEDWGWRTRLDGATWGADYYHRLLPSLVAERAPHVPYVPGSPFSPDPADHPNDESRGSTHLWEQWNRRDWSSYREHAPRFVSEFGWQAPATWATLTEALHDAPLTPESPGMISHQKAEEGHRKLVDGLLPHYRVPRDTESWHWAMQLNQADAIGTAVEHFRASGRTSGAILWQLNDCWPAISWAAIDHGEREKPLFHALRRAFAPRLVTLQPRGQFSEVVLVNDTDEAWVDSLELTRFGFDGSARASVSSDVVVAPRAMLTVPIEDALAAAGDAASELLVASLGAARAIAYFAEPRDCALPPARVDLDVAATPEGCDVTVTARSFVKDVTVLIDKIRPDASVDSALVTLLPGETHTFRVRGAVVAADELVPGRVLCTGNQLVASS